LVRLLFEIDHHSMLENDVAMRNFKIGHGIPQVRRLLKVRRLTK